MTAFGTYQTSMPRLRMSAFGCKEDVLRQQRKVSL
jgi:hypothetical protein